jgi:hypothetical protein
MEVEYRVRPVTRYVVTRFHKDEKLAGVETRGEFDNANVAFEVGYALARQEHDILGYPVGDERIKYPERPHVAPDGFPDSASTPGQVLAGR